MKRRFTDEQIIGFLKEAEAGTSVNDLCPHYAFRNLVQS
jgi:putative transposase